MSRVVLALRALLVWLAATAGAGVLARPAAEVLVPAWRAARSPGAAALDGSFDLLLTATAALALVLAALWGWLVTSVVVVRLLVLPHAASARRLAGVPRPVQRLLLAACGAALTGALALPAHAEPGAVGVGAPVGPAPVAEVLTGLPLPERATASDADVHVVRPGDSLWAIAAARLPEDATDARITAAWQALHRANRTVVGPDPDLVHPAQRLRLPDL